MISRLLRRYRSKDARHANQGAADRAAVMAATAQALAGRSGMPGLLWSQVWLTEALISGENSLDEASFADTIPLTEIRSPYDSQRARMKLRFQQAFVPGDRAA
jgi:hypothetical protein